MVEFVSNNCKVAQKRYFVIEKTRQYPKGMKRFVMKCPVCKHKNLRVHHWTFIVNNVYCSVRMGACCYLFMFRHRNKFRQKLCFPSEEKRKAANRPTSSTKISPKPMTACSKNCSQYWREQNVNQFMALRDHRRSTNGRRGGLVNGQLKKLCTTCRIGVIQQFIEKALANTAEADGTEQVEKGKRILLVVRFCFQFTITLKNSSVGAKFHIIIHSPI